MFSPCSISPHFNNTYSIPENRYSHNPMQPFCSTGTVPNLVTRHTRSSHATYSGLQDMQICSTNLHLHCNFRNTVVPPDFDIFVKKITQTSGLSMQAKQEAVNDVTW